MARIELAGLAHSYKANPSEPTDYALRPMEMTWNDGGAYALLGPSGCGKSTLLRMLAGLEEVTDGEILIGDKVVNNMQPKERDIAMVFQNYALYPHMTVRDNMSFSLKLAKTDRADSEARVKRAAEILGLTSLLERYPRQLSGGQRQRVAMGRAIVRDPQVFLFDEPLSNLDAKLRVQMRTEIKALHQRLKTTSVYVTHDQIEAMTMGDQIVVMRDGRIEQVGGPLALYESPVNTFVAGFIGSPAMNMLPGTLRHREGKTYVELHDGSKVMAKPQQIGQDGQAVLFGTRPEHLSIDNGGELSVVADVIEPTGADTFVTCSLGTTQMCVVFHHRVDLLPGQRVHLRADAAHSHLFDAKTGIVMK
jgi:multiple sugar transport system ATP-binding protein